MLCDALFCFVIFLFGWSAFAALAIVHYELTVAIGAFAFRQFVNELVCKCAAIVNERNVTLHLTISFPIQLIRSFAFRAGCRAILVDVDNQFIVAIGRRVAALFLDDDAFLCRSISFFQF